MRLSQTQHRNPTNLTKFALYGVASVALAALLAIALRTRHRRRHILNSKVINSNAAVDAWENEGGAPASGCSARPG